VKKDRDRGIKGSNGGRGRNKLSEVRCRMSEVGRQQVSCPNS
jgi:hypothetical protein